MARWAQIMDALDRISLERFDAEDICRRLNEFGSLSDDEQDSHLGIWGYAGLDEAQHPFAVLLAESHNSTSVVRDLDGALVMVWEEPLSGEWRVGPLYHDHMPSDDRLEELLDDPEGLDLDHALISEVIDSLPPAPGPVMDY